MVLWGSDGLQSLRAPRTSGRRAISRVLGIVVVLLAVPVVVVLLAAGYLPVTGLFVSSVLLFGAVWLLVVPTSDGG